MSMAECERCKEPIGFGCVCDYKPQPTLDQLQAENATLRAEQDELHKQVMRLAKECLLPLTGFSDVFEIGDASQATKAIQDCIRLAIHLRAELERLTAEVNVLRNEILRINIKGSL
jgi:cell division protein FtsB